MEMETEAKENRAHTVRELEKRGPTGKNLRMVIYRKLTACYKG